jgi:hypothetical protein
MDLRENLRALEESALFQNWKHEHPTAYLVHFFAMTGDDLHIGYYEPEHDTITSFRVGSTISSEEPADVFKEAAVLPKLLFSSVAICFDDAREKALSLQKEKYPQHISPKEIILLQTIAAVPTYTITFVTQAFALLTMRISGIDGAILSDSCSSVMDLASFSSKHAEKPLKHGGIA